MFPFKILQRYKVLYTNLLLYFSIFISFRTTGAVDPSCSNNAGIFCVLHNNENEEYTKADTIQNGDEWEDILTRWKKKGQRWDTEEQEKKPLNPVLLTIRNDQEVPFLLPTSYIGDKCTGIQEISLFRDISFSCSPQWLVFNSSECLSQNFFAASRQLSSSIVTYHNRQRREISFNTTVPLIPITFQDKICQNMISKLSLVFLYNGSLIDEVIVTDLQYTSLTAANSSNFLPSFDIKFQSISSADSDNKPGFQLGDSIPIRTASINGTFLTLPSIELSSSCTIGPRMAIMFNVFAQSGCALVMSNCFAMQEKMQDIMMNLHQTIIHVIPNDGDTVVQMTGNNYTMDFSTNSTCSVLSTVAIEIVYAREGTEKNYRQRIVAALYKVGIVEIDVTSSARLLIPYQVRFRDVTSGLTHQFASLPQLNIQLPHDFFYPFLATVSEPVQIFTYIVSFLIVLILVLVLCV